ncbi:MAG: signal peptidase I [bacterium]|nr:signal peptidase I [bacterium]
MTSEADDQRSAADKNIQSTRETVESIVVAFVLAFLFRAFVAEAFVIPTGSMAPTLMGAHKDLFCVHCGQQYQASASIEYDSTTGALEDKKTIASTCANCRGINAYDFRNNKDHATFSGDRILVSKFDYVLSQPQRWDVFVFKYPEGARMNYIKRLVGLPGETLRIEEGDVFVRDKSSTTEVIARKPPHKIQAMKQLVSNTEHQAADLNRRGWPSSWQPWHSDPSQSNWQVELQEASWQAKLNVSEQLDWLRYFHKVADLDTWYALREDESITAPAPYESQLITDYLAYNTPYVLFDATQLFDWEVSSMDRFLPGFFRRGPRFVPSERKTGGKSVLEAAESMATVRASASAEQNDGYHWVGDLSGEFEVDVDSDAGLLVLDLVEFGIHFRCSIDIGTGEAKLQALESEQPLAVFEGLSEVQAATGVQGKGSYRLEFANFDDQLVLWVNGKPVEFNNSTAYDIRAYRDGRQRRPHWSQEDPLDAAPLGIAGRQLAMTVRSAKVFRDIYYIAVGPGGNFTDFPSDGSLMLDAIPDRAARSGIYSSGQIVNAVYRHPEWWEKTNLFEKRRSKSYELEEEQYFPLGDNSAASSDARAWSNHHYVEQRFLLGKALLVFWPHTWNTPVPFTPNFQRMRLIR